MAGLVIGLGIGLTVLAGGGSLPAAGLSAVAAGLAALVHESVRRRDANAGRSRRPGRAPGGAAT